MLLACLATSGSSASAVECRQADIKGRWLISADIFDSGSAGFRSLVCPIVIAADGSMVQTPCEQVDATSFDGALFFNEQGIFKLGKNCRPRFILVTDHTFDLVWRTSEDEIVLYQMTTMQAWMSPDKQTFMGTLSSQSGATHVRIIATRRP